MGFADGVSAMMTTALTDARLLFTDFSPFTSLLIAVAVAGLLISIFIRLSH